MKKRSALNFAMLGIIVSLVFLAGCGQGKPSLLSFYSKDSKSAKEFEPFLNKLKKELAGKVIFKHYDMKDPKNKDIIKKYMVTMDPTYIVLNGKGEIKHTFMGKPHEDMLRMAIMSFIPSGEKPITTMPYSSTPITLPQPAPGPQISTP